MNTSETGFAAKSIKIGRDVNGSVVIAGDHNVVIFRASTVLNPSGEDTASEVLRNPYTGLSSFKEEDADDFFGRETLIRRLWSAYEHVCLGASVDFRILPIVGPSGCGKSSLVRAGLIPQLARHRDSVTADTSVIVLTPGSHPLDSLAGALARTVTQETLSLQKIQEFRGELCCSSKGGIYDGLRLIGSSIADSYGSRVVLAIDQFEEIYSQCDPTERSVFFANLLRFSSDTDKRLSAILTLRSDFLPDTQNDAILNVKIAERGIIIPAMTDSELRGAISLPAKRAGREFDPGFVQFLVSEVAGREGALPLLEFALTRIWDRMNSGSSASTALEEVGGVGGSLAAKAEDIYQRLPNKLQKTAENVFMKLVQVGAGARDSRRRMPVSALPTLRDSADDVRRILDVFSEQDARLLTLATDMNKVTTVEITHEALIQHWTLLRSWLDRNRDDLRFQARLDGAAGYWNERGRGRIVMAIS